MWSTIFIDIDTRSITDNVAEGIIFSVDHKRKEIFILRLAWFHQVYHQQLAFQYHSKGYPSWYFFWIFPDMAKLFCKANIVFTDSELMKFTEYLVLFLF
ncbi:MAG TPA: hypothetical protein VKA91_09035 [Nitrososphaeraceae archaeon]|nr:hypothetical protein [Nitrososphaeraceae archaeon]